MVKSAALYEVFVVQETFAVTFLRNFLGQDDLTRSKTRTVLKLSSASVEVTLA